MSARTRRSLAMAASLTAVVALAGCGGDNGSSGPAGSGADVSLAEAREVIEPFITQSADFPVTEPLSRRPEPGSTVAYLDLGTPLTALVWDFLQPTADLLDIRLLRVPTGSDAQSINSALNSVVEASPDGVINVAVDPTLFTPQLNQLEEQGASVVSASIVNGDDFGIPDASVLTGREASAEAGGVLAAAILDATGGEASEFVFYNVPELPFSAVWRDGAKEQMAALCPDCTLRLVDIPVSQLGSTASRSVVSDLQANPDTQAFITAIDEIQIGLPAAMKVAGLDVPGIGGSPSPANYEQVAAGAQAGSLVIDTHMYSWMLMDQVVRQMAGEEVSYASPRDLGIYQLISQEYDNVPTDPAEGYLAFPDYQERFAELWLAP